jgi:hypothetical protein
MTKTLICATAISALLSTSAIAKIGAYGGLGYSYYSGSGDSSGIDANAYDLKLGTQVNTNLDVEIKTEFQDITEYDLNNNQLEVALVPHLAIPSVTNGFGIYGRVGLGYNWLSGKTQVNEDFSYGSIEPGVYYKFFGETNPSRVSLGYRYRNSFDDTKYETNSAVLGGEYAIDSTNSIVANYTYADGDESYNQFSIGYLAHF